MSQNLLTLVSSEEPERKLHDPTHGYIRCGMCISPTSRKCITCESMYYCSKTCEMADWRLHQMFCPKPVPVAPVPVTSWSGFKAIFSTAVIFHDTEQTPRFTSFRVENPHVENRGDQLHPAEQLLDCTLSSTFTITHNVLRGRSRSGNQIELYYRAKPSTKGTGRNLSIYNATGGRVAQKWCGPAIAVKRVTLGTRLPQYLDMTLLDVRDVVDQLSAFPAADISDMTNASSSANLPKVEVTAVRINSAGDQSLGRPKFEVLHIRSDHAACRAPISGISQLVQFPLRMIRCTASYAQKYDAGLHMLENPHATFLNMGVDPAGAWGFVGLDWIDPAGSVIVVRADGAPLSPQHLEAMCHWCLFVLKPLFDDSCAMGLHPEMPVSREVVLARIVKSEFERFYVGFDEWKAGVDDRWIKAQWLF